MLRGRSTLVTALITSFLLLGLSSTGALAATTVTPTCDSVNLRTGPGTTYTKKTSVNTGTMLTVVATVTGGSYSATCGTYLSGSSWLRISAIGGRSVSSLYGVTYLYGASKLFATVATPTAAPTATPTATPTAAPTATPVPVTAPPTAAPTAAPTATPTVVAATTTTVTPRCDGVNLRTGASTSYTAKTKVSSGALLTVVATVSGGSYSTTCGTSVSGTSWYRISAIGGRSVSSLYGVSYVYGASKLFTTVATPTAPPATSAPTAVPATAAPPTAAPTTLPTTDPNATADPNGSPAPSDSPAPTATVAPTGTPSPTATPNPVTLPSSITFYGRGYGHGVGLSQYGAYGRALDGQLADDIVRHYYAGTVIGSISNVQVRVLVLSAFAATSTNPVLVYGRGGSWTIDGVSDTFPADAKLKFTPTVSGASTTWKVTVTSAAGTTLYSAASSSSIRIRPAYGTTVELWSKPSAYDQFRGVIRLIGKTDGTSTVNGINEVPLEYYLRGVVPAEVSSAWPIEAIKAQAIAARSYAVYRLHPTTGTYDIYDDTRSQVYRGYLAEKSTTNSAVSATAGKVVRTSGGSIANTLFSSCAGGWTENNENVFVSSTGAKTAGVYSYLRGVSDRRADGTAYDTASPYDTWKTKTYTLAQIQSWFAADSRTNVGTLVKLDLRDRGVSGRLISVTLIGANGTTKKVSADVFRSVFNAHRISGDPMMRSTFFDLIPIP